MTEITEKWAERRNPPEAASESLVGSLEFDGRMFWCLFSSILERRMDFCSVLPRNVGQVLSLPTFQNDTLGRSSTRGS